MDSIPHSAIPIPHSTAAPLPQSALRNPHSIAPHSLVLIVDDSPVQTELLRRALEGAGYKVIAAKDGAEGFAMAKANLPNVVVSDINMPVMDGYHLCHAIRSDEVLKDTPVILLTILSDPQDVIRGLNAGADAYVTKPYNIPTLVSRIESLLACPPVPPPPVERRKVEVQLAGVAHLVDAHGPRMLNLLVSTYENAVLQNRDLIATQQALEEVNEHLEERVLVQTAALQASERRFRSLIEHASDLVTLIDAQGKIVYISPSIKRLGGYEVDELLGTLYLDYAHPDDRPASIAALAELRRNPGKPHVSEFRFRHKDGAWMTLESIARNVLDDSAIGGIVINSRDITDRKLAQEALARKERYYRKLIEGGSDVFFLADPAGTVLYRSESGKQLTGWETAEVLGTPVTNYVLPECLPLVRKAIAETLENPAQSTRVELRLLRKDGTQVEVEALGRNLLSDPDVGGIVVTARDISERKRAQEELEFKNRVLSTQQETSLDAILLVDETAKIISYNRRFVELWGIPEEMVKAGVDEPVLQSVVAQVADPDEFLARVRYLYEHKEERSHEEVRLKDGRILDRYSAPVAGANGRYYGRVWYFRNITERKRSEQALLRVNRALKTLGKCNEALVHATDEAQLLDEMCHIVVETGGYRMAWVGFADDGAGKAVKPMAHFGFEDGYLERAAISWAETARGQGPAGTAIREGKSQFISNAATDPRFAPWREEAIKRNYGSTIALPLLSGEKAFGVFSIYAQERNAFDAEEIALLEELANDLAFGIVTLRMRMAHRKGAEQLQDSMVATVQAIAATVEMRDPYTAGHQRRVAELAVAIAKELGLPDEQIHGLHLAGIVHDLGKIQIPAEILSKPGKLTDIEFSLIKAHAKAGYDILKGVKFPWPIAQIVLQHHERMDGSGYPQELKAEQILLEARILAVADVVEAMASHRPYRPARGLDAAVSEIIKSRGTQFDPAVVDACVSLFKTKGFVFAQ